MLAPVRVQRLRGREFCGLRVPEFFRVGKFPGVARSGPNRRPRGGQEFIEQSKALGAFGVGFDLGHGDILARPVRSPRK